MHTDEGVKGFKKKRNKAWVFFCYSVSNFMQSRGLTLECANLSGNYTSYQLVFEAGDDA